MRRFTPNGMILRLEDTWFESPFLGYDRQQPGRSTADTIRQAARQDRRKHRRPRPDPLRGRLIDLKA